MATVSPYSHLVKRSMMTPQAKMRMMLDRYTEIQKLAKELREKDPFTKHNDILSQENIKALLDKYNINIPKKGFLCPHYRIWVGMKQKKGEPRVKIPAAKFENIAIMVYHEWMLNYLFFRRHVLENPSISIDEEDRAKYSYEKIKDACQDAMLKYFGPFNIEGWTIQMEKFLKAEHLVYQLAIKVYHTDDASMATSNLMNEVHLYLTEGKNPLPKTKLMDYIGATKTVPKLTERMGKLDRIADGISKTEDVKQQYDMVKDLSKDSRYRLRKKGVETPKRGEMIAAMSKEEFDAWCKENNISKTNKSNLKKRYRN